MGGLQVDDCKLLNLAVCNDAPSEQVWINTSERMDAQCLHSLTYWQPVKQLYSVQGQVYLPLLFRSLVLVHVYLLSQNTPKQPTYFA